MSKNKLPRIFRKELTEKKWKRKILKNIHIPTDKVLIEELYEFEDGKMGIRRELTKEERKKLKALGKAVKKNKGMVTRWKLFILLAVVAALVVFNIFFKNMLAERALERGLTDAFEASADVDDLRLSLSKGELSLEGIRVQNRKEPERNLFQTGRTVVRINIPELTRGRYHIDELTLEGLRFNSGRDSSELPAGAESDKKGEPLIDLSAYTDDPATAAEKILMENRNNLKSLRFIESAEDELREFTESWQTRLEESEKEGKAFAARYEQILSGGVPQPSSIEEGRSLYSEYDGYYKEIGDKKGELKDLADQFEADRDALKDIRKEAEALIREDLAYLQDLMQLPGQGDVRNFVSDKIKGILMQRFSSYYETAQKVMPYYEKWRAAQPEEEKNTVRRMDGRDLRFPSPMSPGFLLKKAHLDGGDGNSGLFNADISGISSEPDEWADPIRLSSGWKRDGSEVSGEGFLDLKEEADELFLLDFRSPGNALPGDIAFPDLGIEKVDALLDYVGTARPHPEGEGVLVSLDMDFSQISLRLGMADDPVSSIVRETLEGIEDFLVEAEIHIDGTGIRNLKVDSGIDKVLKDSLEGVLDELPAAGAEMLRPLLTAMIEEELGATGALEDAADALGISSLEQLKDMEALEDRMDSYRDDLQNRGEALIREYEDKARAEAEALKAEAEAEAARLRAEAERKAKEEEERAKAEAQKKLEEEASKLKLPGF